MTKRIHLRPPLYTALQQFVHGGHQKTFRLIADLLEMGPGETVVEIGCGTGLLAPSFVAHGYDYWGIDRDPDRIAAAGRLTPGAHFLVCDALALDRAALPRFRRAFMHGVLHHLDDGQCRHLVEHILSVGPGIVLAVVEPFRERRWWASPLGALCSRMDEGQFIRTLEGWRDLFGANLDALSVRSLWPRWPLRFVDARLTAGPRRAGGIHAPPGKEPMAPAADRRAQRLAS